MKWLLFGLALLMSFFSLHIEGNPHGMAGNSAGGAAAGLWIGFALLHVHDLRSRQDPRG